MRLFYKKQSQGPNQPILKPQPDQDRKFKEGHNHQLLQLQMRDELQSNYLSFINDTSFK